MLNLPALLQNKNTRIGPFPSKRSVLQNPDRERTNQSTGTCLGLGLPYNNGFYSESVKYFFLKCPLFATSRHKLLSSAAQIFADRWAYMYDTAIVSAFLSGYPSLSYDENRFYFCLSRRLS